MALPVGVQLYSIRDSVEADMHAALAQVKELGYDGVEFAGLYGNKPADIRAWCAELGLNPIKVRKLLITAGVYASDVAEKVQVTFDDFRKTQDHKAAVLSTANALGLSRSSVTSYLPYKKGVYFPCTAPADKISVGAERQRRYRAMKRWRNATTEEGSADVRITARSK